MWIATMENESSVLLRKETAMVLKRVILSAYGNSSKIRTSFIFRGDTFNTLAIERNSNSSK